MLRGGVPPGQKFDLLGAETGEFVFYSEFFFFEAYYDVLIRMAELEYATAFDRAQAGSDG